MPQMEILCPPDEDKDLALNLFQTGGHRNPAEFGLHLPADVEMMDMQIQIK